MQEELELNRINFSYIDNQEIKRISDKTLLQKVHKTYEFLQLCEIYLKDVKDDYGKRKIANLRVDIVSYQLEILIRECFARGIKHGLNIK